MIYLFCADVAPLSDNIFFDFALERISDERKQKANKLNFRKDKNLSVGSQLLLIYTLKKAGYDYSSLIFKTEKNGKPYVEGENVFFSVSHSGNMVLCGVSDSPIGVDIQKIDNFNHDIIARFFGKNEQRAILSMKDNDAKKNMFYKIWTLKESYSKMTGEGLGGFRKFEVTTEGNTSACGVIPGCRFFESYLEGYRVGAAFMAEDNLKSVEKIDLTCCREIF